MGWNFRTLANIKIPFVKIPTEFLNIPHCPLPTQVSRPLHQPFYGGYVEDSPSGFGWLQCGPDKDDWLKIWNKFRNCIIQIGQIPLVYNIII
jgi:hypothetical protein